MNKLIDIEKGICSSCKDKNTFGCEGCYHLSRKTVLQEKMEEVRALLK